MKKKIGILGSTGSIGRSVLKLISNNNNFEVIFLTADKNYKKILKQAEIFKVRNIIITNYISYQKSLLINKNKKIKIFNSFDIFKNIIKTKIDYVMSSISGIDGLKPTFDVIKYTKKIAIANKETLICAWPILLKELKKYKTKFIPVDSEHFSIWTEIKNVDPKTIHKIYLTASGGPLLNYNKKSLKNVSLKSIIKHPNWSMGKKISVDSATMMNKCFEIMEAKNIFNLSYKKIDFIIHPSSYVHAIIVYNNGISKIVAHNTTMDIPIFNTIFDKNQIYKGSKMVNFKLLNNLNFQNVSQGKFPIISFLKKLPKNHSFFETVVVTINDTIVNKYLIHRFEFKDISKMFLKLINLPIFTKYKYNSPKNIEQIIKLSKKISLETSKIMKI